MFRLKFSSSSQHWCGRLFEYFPSWYLILNSGSKYWNANRFIICFWQSLFYFILGALCCICTIEFYVEYIWSVLRLSYMCILHYNSNMETSSYEAICCVHLGVDIQVNGIITKGYLLYSTWSPETCDEEGSLYVGLSCQIQYKYKPRSSACSKQLPNSVHRAGFVTVFPNSFSVLWFQSLFPI